MSIVDETEVCWRPRVLEVHSGLRYVFEGLIPLIDNHIQIVKYNKVFGRLLWGAVEQRVFDGDTPVVVKTLEVAQKVEKREDFI